MDLTRFQQQLKGTSDKARPLPPVEKWDPPFCGNINLTIALDGRWFYEGSPIGRANLVKLFASVLKKEDDDYFLVTPVEKVGITVEDVPFLVTEWQFDDPVLVLTTQTGDTISLTSPQQLSLRKPPAELQDTDATPIPYVLVRRNLWARLHQNVYYQLLEQASEQTLGNETQFVINSNATPFIFGSIVSK